MPITLTNLSLIYSVYLPLAIAVAVGWLVFISFRHRMTRDQIALTLVLVLPTAAGIFSFILGYKSPVSVGISALVPNWHSIWFFVSLPASIILGIIFAVIAYESLDPKPRE